MNIVENKHGKFDIDTVEGAEKYLESEGVNIAEYLQKGINELKKHNKILNTENVDTSHDSKVLNIPRVSGSALTNPLDNLGFSKSDAFTKRHYR